MPLAEEEGSMAPRETAAHRQEAEMTSETMHVRIPAPSQRDAELPLSVGDRSRLSLQIAEAVSCSAIAVAEVDLATLRVVAVSDAAAAMVGLSRGELVGRRVNDFVDDEPTGALPLLATGRLDGFEAPRRVRRADGSVVAAYVWVHVLG